MVRDCLKLYCTNNRFSKYPLYYILVFAYQLRGLYINKAWKK